MNNVEIPTTAGRPQKYTEIYELSPGDSLFVEAGVIEITRIRSAIRQTAVRMGRKYRTRVIEEGGVKGCKVWRVE